MGWKGCLRTARDITEQSLGSYLNRWVDGYRGERGLRTMKELAIAAITLIVWKKESARTVSWAECRDKKWSGIEPRGRFFS